MRSIALCQVTSFADPLCIRTFTAPDGDDAPIEGLLAVQKPDVPPMRATFQRAERLRATSTHGQKGMFDG